MKKTLILFIFTVLFTTSYSQTGCYSEWSEVFTKRGAYTVSDDMHRNVIISFIEGGESFCVYGKVRVENGKVVSVFVMYDSGEYQLMDGKLVSKTKQAVHDFREIQFTKIKT